MHKVVENGTFRLFTLDLTFSSESEWTAVAQVYTIVTVRLTNFDYVVTSSTQSFCFTSLLDAFTYEFTYLKFITCYNYVKRIV